MNMNKLIQALGILPEYRNHEEIHHIMEMAKDIDFFNNLVKEHGKQAYKWTCKYIKYEYLNASEYVFLKGSVGTKFYIILDGSVSVFMNKLRWLVPTNVA